jgi:predicted nucleotide-binding protein
MVNQQIRHARKVFIGHGRSPIWKDLRHFLTDRLSLECDEFNREPVAGHSTKERLQEMLDGATVGFLVMTGEDEQADGTVRARENVVHELGLFQGRLGFEKAVILLEEGCAPFSNIEGLTYIGFPKGKMEAASEEIRRVLEREGVVRQ